MDKRAQGAVGLPLGSYTAAAALTASSPLCCCILSTQAALLHCMPQTVQEACISLAALVCLDAAAAQQIRASCQVSTLVGAVMGQGEPQSIHALERAAGSPSSSNSCSAAAAPAAAPQPGARIDWEALAAVLQLAAALQPSPPASGGSGQLISSQLLAQLLQRALEALPAVHGNTQLALLRCLAHAWAAVLKDADAQVGVLAARPAPHPVLAPGPFAFVPLHSELTCST